MILRRPGPVALHENVNITACTVIAGKVQRGL